MSSDGKSQGYILDVSALFPPPCKKGSDCKCPDVEKCATEGKDAGECVPKYGEEEEPNDGPTAANAVELSSPLIAKIATQSDQDWYALELAGGEPYKLGTARLCGKAMDADVTVLDATGGTQLAYDADSGESGGALIGLFVAPAHGTYLIRVRGQKEYPKLRVSISGHTDKQGNAKENLDLSRRRAEAVKDYLVKQGISPDQLETAGYGDTRSVGDNATDAGAPRTDGSSSASWSRLRVDERCGAGARPALPLLGGWR